MELPFVEWRTIVGEIVLGQHRELSSRHIKFEVPRQYLSGKGQEGRVEFSERDVQVERQNH